MEEENNNQIPADLSDFLQDLTALQPNHYNNEEQKNDTDKKKEEYIKIDQFLTSANHEDLNTSIKEVQYLEKCKSFFDAILANNILNIDNIVSHIVELVLGGKFNLSIGKQLSQNDIKTLKKLNAYFKLFVRQYATKNTNHDIHLSVMLSGGLILDQLKDKNITTAEETRYSEIKKSFNSISKLLSKPIPDNILEFLKAKHTLSPPLDIISDISKFISPVLIKGYEKNPFALEGITPEKKIHPILTKVLHELGTKYHLNRIRNRIIAIKKEKEKKDQQSDSSKHSQRPVSLATLQEACMKSEK